MNKLTLKLKSGSIAVPTGFADTCTIHARILSGGTFDSGVVTIERSGFDDGREPQTLVGGARTITASGMTDLRWRHWNGAAFLVARVSTPANSAVTIELAFDFKRHGYIDNAAPTATVTSVGDSASSVTVLAANAARLGASIDNDSSAILYLKLGATASTSSFTVKMEASDHYEVPFGYLGVIDGIWASDAGGSARVTEFT